MAQSIVISELLCIFIYLAIFAANIENFKKKDTLSRSYFGMILWLFVGIVSDTLSYVFSSSLLPEIKILPLAVFANLLAYTSEYFSIPFFITYLIALSRPTPVMLRFRRACFYISFVLGAITFVSIFFIYGDFVSPTSPVALLFTLFVVVDEALLLVLIAVALHIVKKRISRRYWGVGFTIIIGLLLSRILIFFNEEADFSCIFATMSVLLMHLFIQTDEIQKIKVEAQSRENYLMSISMTDALSGLFNRTAYKEHASQFAPNKHFAPTLHHVMIDLNGLKTINDTKGHEAGDELIIAIANCLKEVVSPYGNAYRIGGDEFACVVNANETEFNEMLTRLSVMAKEFKGKYNEGFTYSIGYATPTDFIGRDFFLADLASLADKRMYEDKQRFYAENSQFDRRNKE